MSTRPRTVDERPAEGSGTLAPELMARVQEIQIRTHKLVNTALSGGYRSTFRGTGLEFAEVRPYQPGDEVRSIDWNVTARAGEPYIKTFQEERELTLHLLVDTSSSMDFGSRGLSKREAAAQFAALIAFTAIKSQDQVGLTLFGHDAGLHLEPKKGGRHGLRVIREVLAAPSTGRGGDLSVVLDHGLRTLRRRGIVFLISDFLDQALDAPTTSQVEGGASADFWGDSLASLALRHDVIAVRVIDPLEEALPNSGRVELAGIESNARRTVDAGSRAQREAWEQAARERRTGLDRVFSRARVDALELRTDRDLANPLIDFFRRRQARYGGRVV
ncbi:MAG: DUF58 domain-containing protein [Planctomycetes bacterium]|nr:DUF58 domain-containing protein [Planctomycetota bacterium]MCB9903543.1 DUF58 domain-containing protein [Planctomycetota bacterium]